MKAKMLKAMSEYLRSRAKTAIAHDDFESGWEAGYAEGWNEAVSRMLDILGVPGNGDVLGG